MRVIDDGQLGGGEPDVVDQDFGGGASYGSPASDSTVRKDFYRLLKAADIAPMRLHDLRHSCATIELAAGAPLVAVSEQLGHAKPSITLNVYAHAVPSMRQAVAEAMHRALQG